MHSPTSTQHSVLPRTGPTTGPAFPPLEEVTRPTVDTAACAYYLNRRPQTMRIHACSGTGPIRPLRINGRLAWPVAELRRLLVVGTTQR